MSGRGRQERPPGEDVAFVAEQQVLSGCEIECVNRLQEVRLARLGYVS